MLSYNLSPLSARHRPMLSGLKNVLISGGTFVQTLNAFTGTGIPFRSFTFGGSSIHGDTRFRLQEHRKTLRALCAS